MKGAIVSSGGRWFGQFIIQHLPFDGEEVSLARVVGVVGVLAAEETHAQSRVEMVLYKVRTLFQTPAHHQLFYGQFIHSQHPYKFQCIFIIRIELSVWIQVSYERGCSGTCSGNLFGYLSGYTAYVRRRLVRLFGRLATG